MPMRVAIPYPEAYETGRGRLTALDAGGSAIISLFPAWQVSAREGMASRSVTWHPGKVCMQPHG